MKGLVTKSTGSWYSVQAEGHVYPSRVRGRMRLDGAGETNPVAVGDEVEFDIEGGEGIITSVLPRRNHLLRQSAKKANQSHVLAANIDQVLLLVTLRQPRTSLGFIDRFLVSAESFRIPQVLIFNKTDLLTQAEIDEQNKLIYLYMSLGVIAMSVSAANCELSTLPDVLANKTTLFAGHSGVGKSTLLNCLSPGLGQTVSEISIATSKGVHTTTFAEMFALGELTYVIDTPGVKEWGLVDMNQQEISDYFPEMRDRRRDCKFGSRCLHLTEPRCAILDAVQQKLIAQSRYESYFNMVTGKDNRK